MPFERLAQFRSDDDTLGVGLVGEDGHTLAVLDVDGGTYGLAQEAMSEDAALSAVISRRKTEHSYNIDDLLAAGRVLPPISHPDPAHCLVTGTGLTHLASAKGRDAMHAATTAGESDSIAMYRLGLQGGKPQGGELGVEPEWFYKGDGSIIVAPGAPLVSPHFALDGGEEPELAGIYVIDDAGRPRRLGFSFGNEFSDHVLEKRNYLSLAHSKLRMCSLGAELLVGDLPENLSGEVRIRRENDLVWSRSFLAGEGNMCHSFANLEHHHFKYPQFRRPGDIHIHFFGTATLSFADGVQTLPGDWFEVELPPFAVPLRNQLRIADDEGIVEASPL